MSHHRGVLGAPPQRNHHLVPTRSKSKRLRTKRERNAAKFGPKVPLGGSRRGPAAPLPWLQPPPWGGLALGSPLGPPKPVVITQNRLCHRGLFNREVKSLDVRRLLTPGPGGDCPPPAPQIEEGMVGGVPAEALKELVASLASLLGSFGVFLGRELVSERHRSLVAALRRHRQGLPDLGVFLAHRTTAQPPAGQETPQAPQQEARPGFPGRAVSLGGWEVGEPPAGTPSPLRAVDTPPPAPRTPSPIFGAPRERETPFSWSSAEDEEDETPGRLTQTWGDGGGLLPGPPPFWRSPQPCQEEEGVDEGWTPIAPPAFSPDPPPWGPPQSRDPSGPPRAPRLPRTPKIWRSETSWVPPDPSRPPWDASRPPWDSPDPARAPLIPPKPSQASQIWSPEPPRAPPGPPRPLWEPPNPPRPLWDPRPWSPDLPRAALDHPRPPRTPQLWNLEPPRALLDAPRPLWDPPRPHWEPPHAPGPLWDSPHPPWAPLDPPRFPQTPQLWSPESTWDPPVPPQPPRESPRPPRDPRPWSPEPPEAPQNSEPSRCCCHRLCRDIAQCDPLRHDLLCRHAVRREPPCHNAFRRPPPRPAPMCHYVPCRDPLHCCHQAPKRRRPDWGGVGRGTWGGPSDGPPLSLLPSGCRCPCRGGFEMRRGL
ncbi:uncharacterized protein ACIQIH_002122 isoform 2-T3 [Cyanocitta cristata]